MHIIYELFWHIQIIGVYKKTLAFQLVYIPGSWFSSVPVSVMSEERIKTRDLDATRSIQQDDTKGSRSVNDEDMSYS